MKRKLTTSIFAMCLMLISAAQTFSIVENDTLYINNVPLEQYTSHYIDIVNTSSQDLNMAWESITTDVPIGWEYSLCDLGICYLGIPTGATVAQDVPVSGTGFFGINLTPHSEGSGTIQIKVWDTLFPDDKMLLTWYFSTGTVGIELPEDLPEVVLFPNPVMAHLSITNDDGALVNYQIVDDSGKLVSSFITNDTFRQLDLSSYSAGLYLLTASSDKRTTQIKFIKQ